MTHVTSIWARRYGLPDPAVAADAVQAADDGDLRVASDRLSAAALALGFGAERSRDAARQSRAGWSTPQASRAIADLGAAGDELANLCRGAARAVTGLCAALAGAREMVDRAYRAADAAIAAERLSVDPPTPTVDEIDLLLRRRCGLVAETHAATSSAVRALEEAAGSATRALLADPRDLLPPGVSAPGSPVGEGHPASGDVRQCVAPTAADVDASRRAVLQADLTGADPRRALFARAVARALEGAAAGGTAQLLAYDPDALGGQGAAAVAVGDVGTADAVSVLVPGVGHSPMDMAGTLRLAADLAAATTHVGGPVAGGAAVAWFGYDIPLSWTDGGPPIRGHDPIAAAVMDSVSAIDATAAIAGAGRLGAFTRTMRSVMAPSATLTLVGHSYGSTVVSQAARLLGRDAGVDDIVLLGSPGAGYRLRSAADYTAVLPDHVYTMALPGDPIPAAVTDLAATVLNPFGALARGLVLRTPTGPFGADPNAPAFGAQVIDVRRGDRRGGRLDMAQHGLDHYLSGPALDAVAAVTAGRYTAVPVRGAG